MECIEKVNRLFRHVKNFRRGQASLSTISCTELGKTQFFSVSVFKRYNERMVCNVKMYQKTNDDKSL